MFCMKVYKTKTSRIHGKKYSIVHKEAFAVYQEIKKKSKRRPYLRSKFFNNEKIFLELFWQHLYQKLNLRDKTRRLRFFTCAIGLIKNSTIPPTTKINPNKSSEILHRFFGKSNNGEYFCVQIKEDRRTNQKWLMSVFPSKLQ